MARLEAAAMQIEDPLAYRVAHGFSALTYCYSGHYKEALTHARLALTYPIHASRLNAAVYLYAHRCLPNIAMSASLWMLGYPDQAVEIAQKGLKEATELCNSTVTAYVLASTVFVFLRTGDWPTAQQLIERLLAHANEHRLSTYCPVAVGCGGMLAVLRGEALRGIESLQAAIAALQENQLHRSLFGGALADGFAQAGYAELARKTICDALTWAEGHGALADLPELLRIKGEILNQVAPAEIGESEACLLNSLELARQQSALSLELRSAMSLARLWTDNGRIDEALGLLAPIHGRFSEGLHTRDLVAATKLLADLRSHS
jgi:tetratricopeptide (TPR) repeat protein